MTTLAVLCLALVCSFGTATEADHGSILIADEFQSAAETMPRTNSNHRNNDKPSFENRYLRLNNGNKKRQYKETGVDGIGKARSKRETADPRCAPFEYNGPKMLTLSPPKNKEGDSTYASNITCITKITAPGTKQVVTLTFVDVFEIEAHPECEYDYLEIRDGIYGFEDIILRPCGKTFPPQITSTGPHIWLKFASDDNIEYQGFRINIAFSTISESQSIPDTCFIELPAARFGEINYNHADVKKCKDDSPNSLNIIWKITTEQGSKINLDFTEYILNFPNECEMNLVQVFGSEPNFDHKLAYYCGLVANPITSTDEIGNVIHVRMFAAKAARDKSKLVARYISVRTLKIQDSCKLDEFDCGDGTCIDDSLKCNEVAECRLKADEDVELCKRKTDNPLKEPHILVILIIFSLILSGMCFVFLFKCIRKLYQDHELIKKHIEGSCEDRLDGLMDGELTLDPKQLERDSEPRASLERDNHTNEMYKQQRNRKTSSIDSDYLHETQIDIDDDMWRREAETIPVDADDIRIENKGRLKRSDTSKKEESLRSKSSKEEIREKKDIRDASVGAPDTKESGCQTRESLFQVEPAPSSDGSGTNSRGFSTFGYSGATIARPSPAPANTSQITIELLRQVTPQESIKSQKKMDRRPMSSETTRSAPDVIIVSKPIR